MSESIHTILEELPQTSLTTHVLGALDWIVPGEWQNITTLQGMIESVTGETDGDLVQKIGEKTIQLYLDGEGYQRAVGLYRLVDSASTVAGAAAMANMVGSRFEILSFLQDVTPKPDTVQAIDAGVKFAAELACFCMTNGIPGDSVGDFVGALQSYGKEELMRIGAWVALDCVLPLGPDFLAKITESIQSVSEGELEDNRVFRFVADHLPGGIAEKKALIEQNIQSSGDFLTNMVESRGITQSGVLDRVREYIDIADDKLDAVAAAIDLSTNYFEHTGVQTVARRIVSRAYGEI